MIKFSQWTYPIILENKKIVEEYSKKLKKMRDFENKIYIK